MRYRSVLVATQLAVLGLFPGAAHGSSVGPALRIAAGDAAAALSCPDEFRSAHEPLLFIHGTTYTAKQAWSWNYGKVLPPQGYDVCTVQLPDLARGDVQVSTEFVVSAIRTIAARSGRNVDVVSFSQARWEPPWA